MRALKDQAISQRLPLTQTIEIEGVDCLPRPAVQYSLNKKKRWLLVDQIKDIFTETYGDTAKDVEVLSTKPKGRRRKKLRCEKYSLCKMELYAVDETKTYKTW